MKRFSFSLQKLLNLREFREKEAEIALGKANSVREAIVADVEDVAQKRVASSFERRSGVSVQDLLVIENYINRLDARKEKLLADLASAELVLEEKRAAYMQATRDRQVITKLREKKEAIWHKDNLDDEAAVLDDISNNRARNA